MSRSTVEQLPEDIREWLEAELLRRNFSGYAELTDELNRRLEPHGLEIRVSRSSLHRWGQQFEDQVDALKKTTLAARTIARELGDDEGALTDAVIRLVQDKLFRLVVEGDLPVGGLNKVAHAVADLSRASVLQKKHQQAVRERAEAAADAAEKIARKGGLSAEAVEAIKREILGIAA